MRPTAKQPGDVYGAMSCPNTAAVFVVVPINHMGCCLWRVKNALYTETAKLCSELTSKRFLAKGLWRRTIYRANHQLPVADN
jgi:hypothetical protein